MRIYALKDLPNDIQEKLLTTYIIKDNTMYREGMSKKSSMDSKNNNIFQVFDHDNDDYLNDVNNYVIPHQIIWGTDNYLSKGAEYGFNEPVHDLSVIIPRTQKNPAEQKRRVKEKAEVFTPSWLCNMQNNLVDDDELGPNSFNTMSDDRKSWIPKTDNIAFPDNMSWKKYINEKKIEICCGEGPYLMSRYDTTTGKEIPVRDDKNRFARIGILDRKLRVVSENATKNTWNSYAKIALLNTFGYEWQGDNLLLARLNFINTYIDYYHDFFKEYPSHDDLLLIAEIASWNIWQMDSLKMVIPMSCTNDCPACKKNLYTGHSGLLPVYRFYTPQKDKNNFIIKAFETMIHH